MTRVQLFVPEADAAPTGGNLFNRRVVDALADRARLDRVEVPLESVRDALRDRAGAGVLCLLDSLYLQALEPRWLKGGAPVVHLVHYLPDCDPRHGWAQRAAWRPRIDMLLRAASGCIVTSDYMASTIGERLGRHRVRVCAPGLDRVPLPDRGAVGTNGHPQPVRLLTVANLEPRKGVRELLRCLAGLNDLDWRWDVVGSTDADPTYARELREDIEYRGVAERVTLHGSQPPEVVRDFLQQADVFALLTRYEPYGMVFAEAVGAGVPSVGYRSGGVPEAVEHGVTGLLARTRDDEGIADHLRVLLSDAALRQRMRTACAQARERFPSWRACAESLVATTVELVEPRALEA